LSHLKSLVFSQGCQFRPYVTGRDELFWVQASIGFDVLEYNKEWHLPEQEKQYDGDMDQKPCTSYGVGLQYSCRKKVCDKEVD